MKRPLALLAPLVAVAALVHLAMPLADLIAAERAQAGLAGLLLVEFRLPRTLLVLAYGLAAGISGAAIQAAFANPLASPDVSGATGGAALAVVVAAYLVGVEGPVLLALVGMVGALTALGGLFLLAGPRAGPTRLLLAGIALSLAVGAGTTLALALAPSPYAFYDAFGWLMGDFADHDLRQALVALVPALLGCTMLLRQAGRLDLGALGAESAAGLGVSMGALARSTVGWTALALGACVSVAGSVGFIGLVAPILARRLVDGLPGRALLPAGLIAALLLLLADLAARLLPLDNPLPVGVLTALVGTPVLIAMVLRQRTGMAS